MNQLDAEPGALREAAGILERRGTPPNPLTGAAPMPSGPAPTVAADLNASVRWWSGRVTALAGQAADAALALRDNADAYERVDQRVTDRLRTGQRALSGQPGVLPAKMGAR
ncbi:hypothetical protein [Cellulomonas bogoriensis]|uniref:Uncharacterized protein n=1 Tax=Cellulomonas bogoriensis 69B4 = DSM 16987 TaxID=1386082 RepID=A0A0A0BKG7_9CELL|nr:hypothetical protein [Cellulomonas bogoriensis]KGM09018.1 hypothetical protein N869_08575 [Cellulomonas bogoriensis 69B4 = DSM 16987]